MLKKVKLRRGHTVPSPLSYPSTNEYATTGLVGGCDDRFSGWLQRPDGYQVCRDSPARAHHTGFIRRGYFPPMGDAGGRPEFEIKSPFGAPLLILPWSHLVKSFPQGYNSARQRNFEIRVSHLLIELPKAIRPYLPLCQSYRWQLGHVKLSSPTTKSLDPILVIWLRCQFLGTEIDSSKPVCTNMLCPCARHLVRTASVDSAA